MSRLGAVHGALRLAAAAGLSIALTVCVTPSAVSGQVVRGRVSEQISGAPVTGALVELLFADSMDARAASALSDPAGDFALRAPGAGRYRLSAKRIGVRRFIGPAFTLAPGESRTEAITLAAVDFRLPQVVVTANTICSAAPSEQTRVAALWDEARTALDAAEISLRDKLFTATVTRYVRTLDPKSLRVLSETRSEVRGVVTAPFNALPAESLSVVGYWHAAPGGGTAYYGPDPGVLRSEAFLDAHCFRPVEGRGDKQGFVGLAFAPVAERGVPDIVGTIWLDAKSYELRLVAFRYDRVTPGIDPAALGGELHFARLPNGAWLVRRWQLRVPDQGRSNQPVATEGRSPWILLRPSDFRLSEEGGEVTTDAMRAPRQPASIAGILYDSTGRTPVAGASVSIGGSERSTMSDASGRFAFDSLSPGRMTLVARLPGYDALGLSAGITRLELSDGDERAVTMRAFDAAELTSRLCDGRAAPWGRGTVHATVRDRATGAPVAGTRATLTWMSTVGQQAGDSIPATVEAVSDERGALVFCEVPSGRELTIEVAAPAGTGAPAVVRTTIEARTVRHVELPSVAPVPNE